MTTLIVKDFLEHQEPNTYICIKTKDNAIFNGSVEDALNEEKYMHLQVYRFYPLYFADLERIYIVYETENLNK